MRELEADRPSPGSANEVENIGRRCKVAIWVWKMCDRAGGR